MQLHEYQKSGIIFLKERKSALLADDMGLGKSAQAIIAAKELGLSRVLVISPASVKYNWKKEIEKWNPGASTFVVDGTSASIPENYTYTVVNYDLLPSKRIFLQLIGRHYDLIVCDEAHYLKNFRAKRTKCVYYPKGFKDRADRIWLLTGTPVLNRPLELYPHLRSLSPERIHPFVTFVAYTERYCGAYKGKWGWDATGATNVSELAERLKGFMLRRLKSEVLLELPEVTHQKIYINASKKLTELAARERTEYEKTKENILGELASVRRESGVLKVPFVLDHANDLLESKRKIVVFAYHRDVIQALLAGLKQYNPVTITGATPSKDRQEAVERFRTSETCRVFIGQIEAGGTGIDGLQDVCDTIVFAEMSWVPGQIHQAVGRCHRIGQKNAVLAQYLIVENSVDEDIVSSVEKKEAVIKRLIQPTMTNPKEGEEEMPTENEKRVAVTVTVEVDAVTVCDAIVAVANGMKAKGAEVTKVHGAQVVLSLGPVSQIIHPPTPEAPKARAEEAPKPAEKKTRKAKTEEAPAAPAADDLDFGGGSAVEKETGLTADEFLKYCNGKLNAINPPEKRRETTQKVAAMFREKFNCMAVRQIPVGRLQEAKEALDTILEGVK